MARNVSRVLRNGFAVKKRCLQQSQRKAHLSTYVFVKTAYRSACWRFASFENRLSVFDRKKEDTMR
jgi:hypothetical protein